MNYFWIFVVSVLCGCAYVETNRADPGGIPNGVRVYPTRLYIAVDEARNMTRIFTGPDMRRAYDIRPVSIFAKHDFQLDITDGQISQMRSNQDSTAFLTFIRETAALAAKAAGLPVSSENIEGTFGLRTGLYTLSDSGSIERVPTPP